MCGIVGIARHSHDAIVREDLHSMRDSMRHRGPDDAGAWWSEDGRIALAQRRLAIIDLSANGHQPMADVSGQYRITFNGEIYNYRELRNTLEGKGCSFRSSSDTEVILAAYRVWGTDCLERLNGMFAFCLYDRTAQHLFVARDRVGEKPLFYRHAAGQFSFASELKSLMADSSVPRRINRNALEHYLAFGYVPGAMCILEGVRKLPQGHAMIYDPATDDLRVWRYWRPPAADGDVSASDEELLDELEDLLADSVRRQLVADVPVGILLSGGIDSSLVTAMVARASSAPVRTFTISFPGHGSYNEAPYARKVASYFGTEHTELVAEPATVDLLSQLARQYDEPIADSSMVPTYLVSRLIRQHATVALGGDGGDELFGGYTHYGWSVSTASWPLRAMGPARSLLGLAAETLPVGMKGRNYLMMLASDAPHCAAGYFDRTARRRLLSSHNGNGVSGALSPEAYKRQLSESFDSPLRKATGVDLQTYLVDDILVKVDRASMLTSLEVRAPWLDYRLIEFAFRRVPDRLKATPNERKVLPRRLARRCLPPDLDLSRKQGFSLPLASWFQGKWGDYIEEVLREADSDLFNPSAIRSLIAGQRRGYSNTARLFSLAIFELWRRHYRISL